MSILKRKSTWDKVADAAPDLAPKTLVKGGLTTVGTLVGVTVASALVSALRRRTEQQ